ELAALSAVPAVCAYAICDPSGDHVGALSDAGTLAISGAVIERRWAHPTSAMARTAHVAVTRRLERRHRTARVLISQRGRVLERGLPLVEVPGRNGGGPEPAHAG